MAISQGVGASYLGLSPFAFASEHMCSDCVSGTTTFRPRKLDGMMVGHPHTSLPFILLDRAPDEPEEFEVENSALAIRLRVSDTAIIEKRLVHTVPSNLSS